MLENDPISTCQIYFMQILLGVKSLYNRVKFKIMIIFSSYLPSKTLFIILLPKNISLVQFSRLVMSNSLRPNELQHARPPCPSPTPRVYSNSYPSSWWCHPTSSSVVPFSCCPQSIPASGSFQSSQFFTSGDQTTGVSASTSVLPMNTQDWSPLGWTD